MDTIPRSLKALFKNGLPPYIKDKKLYGDDVLFR